MTASLSDTDLSPAGCFEQCGSAEITYVAIDGNGDCRCYTSSDLAGTALGDSSICSYTCPGADAGSDEKCGRVASFDTTIFSVYSAVSLLLHPAGNRGAGDTWATSATDLQCGVEVGHAGSTIEFFNMVSNNLLVANGSANTANPNLTYQFDYCSGTVSNFLGHR